MQRDAIEKYLNTYLNAFLIKDYCPNGLQIEGKSEIKTIATAVSANLMTLEKAVEYNVDALVVHHGLFWNQDPYPIVGAKKIKIDLLLKHEISLFAYHLPLDIHREVGNNWKAACDLGWQNLEPFGEFQGSLIGVKGKFSSKPIEEFVSELEVYYGHGATAAFCGNKDVQSAALVSGGAYKSLTEAAQAKVDCFITGNFDEPAWGIAHEEHVHFLALGHSATEKIGPKALSEHIQNQLKLKSFFLDVPNPF